MAFNIGNDEVDVKTRMGLIDTFTVRSYTVILDSVPTSGLSNPAAVIGKYDDVEFGTVTASSFFRVVQPEKKYKIPNDAVFDSVTLFLIYDGNYYYGDTLAPFTINVHRLSENLKPHDDGYFYNHDSIAAYPEIFGKATFKPTPNSKDTVWIRLDQTFGTELYEFMDADDQVVTDDQSFLSFLKGFMLRYDESNKAIIGFTLPVQSSGTIFPAMRVHFHYFDETTKKSYYDFKVQPRENITADSRYQLLFNRFVLRNPLISLPSSQQEKLPVALTGNRSFVQAGIGIVTRFEIPYLKNLYFIDDDIRILDAKLIIEPFRRTYDEKSLPENISLYTTDNLNRWGNIILNKTGKSSVALLEIDLLYEEETKYTFDVTNFLISKLVQESDVIPAMLLTVSPDDLYKTNRRLVLGSQSDRDNKVKLTVQYMNIE